MMLKLRLRLLHVAGSYIVEINGYITDIFMNEHPTRPLSLSCMITKLSDISFDFPLESVAAELNSPLIDIIFI